ncbi:ATP-dependent helicase hrpB [Granulibacter bethesdensis]|uniref:ATP-dependent helicase hrpB n=2 Tax=Granulibacter bethesdensis TaxID=364410 RepID=A0AAN0VEQ8_9PROT|nr:ATP-dependent helicase hrpB [Granulibacter bethesdensis]
MMRPGLCFPARRDMGRTMSVSDLPVKHVLPALRETLIRGNAVLVAPPGAGKTTTVPLFLLGEEAPFRRMVMLEPRRLAARAAASRMASLIGQKPGELVGYRTRTDSAVSDATRIEVITEGLLVRRLQSDPGLEGVDLVILDEIHERSLDADIALAFCLDLQRALRPELRLLAMSATADGARLSTLMQAGIVESAGQAHPVGITHSARDLTHLRDIPEATARAVRTALSDHQGDLLAFLPGMGEIRRVQTMLDGCGATVLPLHGDLPPAEQDRTLRPLENGGRRVVLATSIAETSLTVPGVRIVVDSGWRRAPRLDTSTGLTRLATLRISRAAAAQRAGRAGREAPGIAIRLWSQAMERGMAPFDRPEILEAELSGLVLDCAGWGASPSDLPFPDAPPDGAVAAARSLLGDLGALDPEGRITEAGRQMARIGAHPRLAAMMLAARTLPERLLAADIAALLEERDPFRNPDAPADLMLRLEALRHEDPAADREALARIRQTAAQYRRRLKTASPAIASPDPAEASEAGPDAVARLIVAAFPDRVAQARGEAGSFRLSGGGGAKVAVNDPLARSRLLAVASLEVKTAPRIRLAVPVEVDTLRDLAHETTETMHDSTSGTVYIRRKLRLGALVLEDRLEKADPAAHPGASDAMAQAAFAALVWSDTARQLRARVELMRTLEPDKDWPDWSDDALAATAPDWLGGWLGQGVKPASLDVAAMLRAALPWQLAQRLDKEMPTHLSLAGNARAGVDYLQPVPVASARAQAFYGLQHTPQLAGGRIPLRLALLSPAGRPVAITADLAGFWQGGWADVRRDMRGRYPRHRWPENPAEG